MAFENRSSWARALALALAACAAPAWPQTQPPRQVFEGKVEATTPDPANEPAFVSEFDDGPLSKMPLSASVITARDLRDAGLRSLSSLARRTPSVSDAYNTTGFIESLQVRGFLLDGVLNYRRNGLPVSNYAPFAPETKERIEILEGLSGAAAGTGSPGGLVEYTTKRPAPTSLREVNADFSERGTWNLGADISERTDALGFRFNVATEERRPYARDAHGDRRLAAGAMDLKLPGNGIFEFEIEWQRSRQISVPAFGLLARDGDSAGTILPPPIDPRINLNDQPWSQPFESRQLVGTVRLEQPLDSTWSVGVRALAQRIMTNDRIAFPDGCSTQSVYVYPGLCSNYDVDLYDYRSNRELRTTRSSELYAIARFESGGIGQRVMFGTRATRYAERLPERQAYNFVGTTNVFADVPLPENADLTVVNTDRDLSFSELYAYDALKLSRAWSAWVGARYVRVKSSSRPSDGSGDGSVALSKSVITPWAALAFEAWTDGVFYLSAGSGLEAAVVPNRPTELANAGAALAVGRSRQVEIGYKQALNTGGRFELAIFDIRKPYSVNLDTPDANVAAGCTASCQTQVANGRTARHRGVELGIAQPFGHAFSMDLQASYLDARNSASIDPALIDKRVTNVPNVTASLGANLRPTEAVDVVWRNRVSYAGTKEVLPDNSVALPASWQWDTSVAWVPAGWNPRLQVRAGIDNVTDRRYWREAPTQSWGATYLFPAQPRTYRVGMSAQW